jgi:hypothetical protein
MQSVLRYHTQEKSRFYLVVTQSTTDPSSRQRKRPTSTNLQLSESNKDVILSPRWVFYSKTDWPNFVRQSPASKGLNTEAEEATALEAVTRRQPMKIQQTEKNYCML